MVTVLEMDLAYKKRKGCLGSKQCFGALMSGIYKAPGHGMQRKGSKESLHPWSLSLPQKELAQLQGKLYPAMQMFPVLTMQSTSHLPISQSFPDNQLGLPSCGRVTPPVTLPRLLLCFCQLARATHCFPQGPNKWTNAWPRASFPIPVSSAHREGWQTALYFYCSFSQAPNIRKPC